MTDAAGAGIIVEAGKWTAETTPPDTTQLITDAKLRAALPSGAFLAAHSQPDFRHGLYVRNMSYALPAAFVDNNGGGGDGDDG
eukprot:CAMPEP_0203827204 /NCGR_PEP_ID=MMETSP0115-20131106/58411_1 /ASSEMBLY_ACC=CAM_ASM_000227 /TAXON_ID=33651 /ORGANISM="Bicosoecid sp, Strain ms1" /LENGTH=82 /DNA_ID=CAMNT_0050736257 /DNA_START=52 /DNA_END=296 /DNA_ORIENTATION=-